MNRETIKGFAFMKSIFIYSFVMLNVILNSFFYWACWLANSKLPEDLGSEVSADLFLQKYQNVRADFGAWISCSCFILLILVNAVAIWTYIAIKKKQVKVTDVLTADLL